MEAPLPEGIREWVHQPPPGTYLRHMVVLFPQFSSEAESFLFMFVETFLVHVCIVKSEPTYRNLDRVFKLNDIFKEWLY